MPIDFAWKVLIGGQAGVGKTTFMYRFIHHEFRDNLASTIGVEFHSQIIESNNKIVNLVLWDLGGQQHFRSIHSDYIRGANAGFICFDLKQINTLKDAANWIDMFRSQIPNLPILLIGTKLDLVEPDQCVYMLKMANQMCLEKNLQGFIQTSAKHGINIDESIYQIIDLISDEITMQSKNGIASNN